ncbi:MAG TPA: choice-of-anchor D domain-containing protein [Edaphobacter sp.]
MRRLAAVVLAALCFAAPAIVWSQTSASVWYLLNAPEESVVTATGPITLRFGQVASTCAVQMSNSPCSGVATGSPSPEAWTAPQTFTPTPGSTTVSVIVSSTTFNDDPLPGVYKTVEILEQSTVQNIAINGQPVTVPTLSPPLWYLLNAPEGSVITATGPITLRYGQVASTCANGPCSGVPSGSPSPEAWSAPQTFTPAPGSTTVSIIVSSSTFNGDPLPGVYKTVEIQEQSTVQNIAINGQPVTVPALSSLWYLVNSPEGSVITASSSITLRYGQVASTCVMQSNSGPCNSAPGSPSPEAWTDPQTFTPAPDSTTVTVIVGVAAFNNVDPLPGVYKTVQIQEQSTVQNITINGQPVTVPALSGASTCQLTANPASITFPNTTLGYNYSSVASIINSCPTAITVTSVQITGPYSASGYETPFSVASGQTQTYTAFFTPTTTGSAVGSIAFVSNAATGQTLSVSLTGSGVTPPQGGSGVTPPQGLLSSNPTTLSFGNVTVNGTQSQSVTITNTGAASVIVSGMAVTGAGFSLSYLATPFTLASNQSTSLSIAFAPTTSGSAAGTLAITSTAQNGTLTVPLTGSAVSHSVTLSWAETGSQIAGYNVYRSIVSGGSYSKVNSTLVAPTNYTDQAVIAGSTYFYVVTAVGTNGGESGYSNQITAVIPSP